MTLIDCIESNAVDTIAIFCDFYNVFVLIKKKMKKEKKKKQQEFDKYNREVSWTVFHFLINFCFKNNKLKIQKKKRIVRIFFETIS